MPPVGRLFPISGLEGRSNRAAQATIQAYGDGAGLHAAQRADELMAEGDMEGRRVWHRIEATIDELARTVLHAGEASH